jgi:predicted transcriptional regulator
MKVIDAIKRAQRVAPVDVIGLATDLGLDVRPVYLDEKVSGELEHLGNGRYIIYVNAHHAQTRQRFTIAHELGHYLYHRDLIGSGVGDDTAYRSTIVTKYFNTRIGPAQETEANRFAANLLMPYHLIEQLRAEGLDRKTMAARLQVSEHALAIRLGEPYP